MSHVHNDSKLSERGGVCSKTILYVRKYCFAYLIISLVLRFISFYEVNVDHKSLAGF